MTRTPSRSDDRSLTNRTFSIVLSVLLVGSMIAAGAGNVGAATAANAPEEAVFEIDGVTTNAPITTGETFTTTIDVTNTGNQTATKLVRFRLGDHYKDSTRIELAPGESRAVELSWDSTQRSAGTWEYAAETPDDTVTRTVEIETAEQSGVPDESTDRSDEPDEVTEPETTTAGAAPKIGWSKPTTYVSNNVLPATVTVGETTVPTMPPQPELRAALAARDGSGYNYTTVTAEVDGNETTVRLVDIDGDSTPEMALIDRNGDGTADPTRAQFHALYPNVNWDMWRHLFV